MSIASEALDQGQAPAARRSTPHAVPALPIPGAGRGGDGPVVIDTRGMEVPVVQLAIAVGLLRRLPGDGSLCALNPDWFSDPVRQTGVGLASGGPELARLIAQLIGQVSGNALGAPVPDPGALGTWYPINRPGTGEPSGLYLATHDLPSGTGTPDTVYGLGVMSAVTVALGNAVQVGLPAGVTGPAGVAVRLWGVAPAVRLGGGTVTVAAGRAGVPFRMGFEVTGAGGEPLVDAFGVSFAGLRMTVDIDPASAERPVVVSLVLLKLKLAGETTSRDRTLADLRATDGAELLATAASMALSALARLMGDDPVLGFVLPALGLGAAVPGVEGVLLPILRWDRFFALAAGGGDLGRPFIEWFNAVAGDPARLKAWMTAVGGALGGGAVAAVTGDGTRETPCRLSLLDVPGVGTLSLTAATTVEAGGVRRFLPGIDFVSAAVRLGSSGAAMRGRAAMELLNFALALPNAPGQAGEASAMEAGRFRATMDLVNIEDGEPLFAGRVAAKDYVFGSLNAGLTVVPAGAGTVVLPAFTLNGVTTPTGRYDAIDLTRPGDLVDVAEAELVGAIDLAFRTLFGLDGPDPLGPALAALVGVFPPPLPPEAEWPAMLVPPFSAKGIAASLQFPVAALSRYWGEVIRAGEPVHGRPPLYWFVAALVTVLRQKGADDGAGATVGGKGTAEEPWRAPIGALGTAADLLLYVEDAPDGTGQPARRMVAGLGTATALPLTGDATLAIDARIEAIALITTDEVGAGIAAAQIFPGVGITGLLPQGVESPPVAGAALAVGRSSLKAFWSPDGGWRWSMVAGSPALVGGGVRQPVGAPMDFSDPAALQRLVTDPAAGFAPILCGVLGVALYRVRQRAGLALNGWLGLLPDLGPVVPKELDWPADMPVLAPTGFDDPLGQIRRQLRAVLATGERAKAALGLLGWAIGGEGPPPAVAGDGRRDDPYLLPLSRQPSGEGDEQPPKGMTGRIWQDDDATRLGLGLERQVEAVVNGIRVVSRLALDAVAFDWDSGLPAAEAGVPCLFLAVDLGRSEGPLATVFGQTLHGLTLGLRLTLDATAQPPAYAVEPILSIERPDSVSAPDNAAGEALGASLSGPAVLAEAALLVNAGIQAVADALKDDSTFQTIYRLLTAMGIALPVLEPEDRFGIDPAGFRALLADPLGFTRTGVLRILGDAALRRALFDLLRRLLGMAPKPVPEGAPAGGFAASVPESVRTAALEVLAGLGLVLGADHGYAPDAGALLAVARDPVRQLVARFRALMEDEARRAAVVAALTRGVESGRIGPVTFTAENARAVRFAIAPEDAVGIGSFAALSGALTLDLQAGRLDGALNGLVRQAGFALAGGFGWTLGDDAPVVGAELRWSDGKGPAPAPLTLWPFDQDRFIRQLAALGPAYALSMFVAGAIDTRLLAHYPLARVGFQALGLTERDPYDGAWRLKSVLSLFEDPVGWLLSGAVLGRDGLLDIPRVREVLAELPTGTAANGVALARTEDTPERTGVALTGLPYGVSIALSADTAGGLFHLKTGIDEPLPLAEAATLKRMRFALGLGADCQPGLTGGGRLTAAIPGLDAPLFFEAGYDRAFTLRTGEEGEGLPQLDLIPFAGWQSFAAGVARQVAQGLLASLTGTLLQGIRDTGGGVFADRMERTARVLDIPDLVRALIAAQPDPGRLGAAALGWLRGRLSGGEAPKTAAAVADLLSLGLTGVSSEGGLLRYRPSDRMPIAVLAGVRTLGGRESAGVWAECALSVADRLALSLEPSGVAVALDGPVDPRVQLGLTAGALFADGEGPALTVRYDSAEGTVAVSFNPLRRDPLRGGAGAPGPLNAELLPRLFGEAPGPGLDARLRGRLDVWLAGILRDVLPRYASIILLNTGGVVRWLDAPLFKDSTLTPGAVLTGSRLLARERGTYVLASLDALATLGPARFLGGFLKALTAARVKVMDLGGGGGLWVEPGAAPGDFGVRVAATGLNLPAAPNLTFQLGAPDMDWLRLTGGDPDRFAPGLAIYVPVEGDVPSFDRIKLRLVNIGVDFHGKAGKPLVELARFRMESARPRGLVTFDFARPGAVVDYGGGIEFTDMGIALAPDRLADGAQANPVAQNLLGSGDRRSRDNPPTNPAFSARAAWLKGHDLGVELFDGTGAGATRLWMPVQRSFGPVHANGIGIGWENPTRVGSVLFDGDLSLAGLSIDLIDLSVSANVTRITDYSQYRLDLGGLEVGFTGGPVTIDGGLVKEANPLRYDGRMLVRMAGFSLYAVGSFALVPVDPARPAGDQAASFFVFLNLNTPLGGPPAFFIEGLAGGFAVNRALSVPAVGDVLSFPLVQGAGSPDTFGAAPTPASALAVLSAVSPPSVGEHWAAAGFQFSSFRLLKVAAMLLLKFGREFEIDVIGVARGFQPPERPPSQAFAYIELALVAAFRMAQGEISVSAQLTPNSFLLVRDCRLSGGFAAKYWFGDNPLSGAFVVSLGGYHPAFTVPDGYPTVPRVGFSWPILDGAASLSIQGTSYFALTPAGVMAGARLQALFTAGRLRAWFNAAADFLIAWQPFYFRAEVEVEVGVSVTVKIFGVKKTLSASLGARLQLWGPEFAGKATVDWYVVSFTIPIGNQKGGANAAPLDWREFERRLLPVPAVRGGAGGGGMLEAGPAQTVLLTRIADGLLDSPDGAAARVRSAPFRIEVQSAIPATTITLAGIATRFTGPAIGIQPMNLPDALTALAVALEGWNAVTGAWEIVSPDRPGLAVERIEGGAAAALWSRQPFRPNGKPTAGQLPGALFGLALSALAERLVGGIGPMDLLKSFGYEKAPALNLPYDRTPAWPADAPLPQENRFRILMDTVMAPSRVAVRAAILEALDRHGVAAGQPRPALSVLAAFADQIYQAAPSLARLGTGLAPAPRRLRSWRPPPVPAEPVAVAPLPARWLAVGRLHALPAGEAAPGRAFLIRQPRQIVRWAGSPPRETAPVTLTAGGIALLDAGRGGPLPVLTVAGSLPVRVVAHDEAGRVLRDAVAADSEVALPAGTVRVAAVGLPDETAAGAVVGWDRHSLLLRADHHTLLAAGCSVRTQASPPLWRGGRLRTYGAVEGGDLLTGNRVQTGVGVTAPGWVMTLFHRAPRTVVVLMDDDPLKAAVTPVFLAATPSPWEAAFANETHPSNVRQIGGGTALLFDTARLDTGDGMRIAVMVAHAAGLGGVYGFQEAPGEVERGWSGHRLAVLGRAVARHAVADRLADGAAGAPPAATLSVRQPREE
ncbi:hypothetical protein J2847_005931 [Azospirillum agricola]|uniref:DUF6603 domain-containing protein n=1 Tax=Azospirillum agricola TaxID=1720247 RepID=UPI001AE23A34|nr:DUF6603 domain-containing protein [Azospirillum agricola]MBP2232600.1 hypothetical protein [Azospirillum agricola]